ncbi:type II toxin-antitoxin system VapC family toxin [Echinicola marina]|uniref:type II toxin-antitoxin system VapC family toxin n=1 Tax=Echinicola marina TaxID=2859768 RepID=UPI001CF65ACA|nr:type II toxin-antitoxin system VapC family toxin [Echinicola marina]UCS91972.1 type II toxin-antitoxin system VapC family toxin [Echinicola marina]UCS91976.1 type II toxin-antitoxin system VapC family toxin [Echinicola marina]
MQKAYLVDTHALLWFLAGDDAISENAKTLLLDTTNRCYVSIASLWEIAIKIKLGKLSIDADFKQLAELLYQNDIEIIQITFEHIAGLMDLDDIHRDPFDRIIISTALVEDIPVITKDQNFPKYKNLKVIW